MLRVLWRLTRGYRLRPWRSPYLRWRIETYWGLHAEEIGFSAFWRFVRQEWRALFRYVRWAALWT
jgi:hypothetical protein